MMHILSKHHTHYAALFLVLATGVIGVSVSPDNKQLQTIFVILTSFLYVVFGILHHYAQHDLTTKIMVEYVLIGSLGMSIILFILKGGL